MLAEHCTACRASQPAGPSLDHLGGGPFLCVFTPERGHFCPQQLSMDRHAQDISDADCRPFFVPQAVIRCCGQECPRSEWMSRIFSRTAGFLARSNVKMAERCRKGWGPRAFNGRGDVFAADWAHLTLLRTGMSALRGPFRIHI